MSEEANELKKRFIFGIAVVLLFFIPAVFIFINKFNDSNDPPIIKRIDIDDISLFAYKIKIDHHPFEEKFCDIELIDENKSSTCEMIIDLCIHVQVQQQ